MPAADIIEAIDVLKEGLGDLVARRPTVPPDQLCFYGFEEGLDSGIVVAITLATHRHSEA